VQSVLDQKLSSTHVHREGGQKSPDCRPVAGGAGNTGLENWLSGCPGRAPRSYTGLQGCSTACTGLCNIDRFPGAGARFNAGSFVAETVGGDAGPAAMQLIFPFCEPSKCLRTYLHASIPMRTLLLTALPPNGPPTCSSRSTPFADSLFTLGLSFNSRARKASLLGGPHGRHATVVWLRGVCVRCFCQQRSRIAARGKCVQ
jgi:hypothetical protein